MFAAAVNIVGGATLFYWGLAPYGLDDRKHPAVMDIGGEFFNNSIISFV
jgi:hypothetical protein